MNLLQSNDVQVKQLTERATSISQAYKTGAITKSEYDELCEDITDVTQIGKLAAVASNKALLSDVVNIVKACLKV